jgi:hypothetical protein
VPGDPAIARIGRRPLCHLINDFQRLLKRTADDLEEIIGTVRAE